MDYQQYIEHLSITMPGTVPVSYETWQRAQLEKKANRPAERPLNSDQYNSDTMKSSGLEIDEPSDANIMHRYYEDD